MHELMVMTEQQRRVLTLEPQETERAQEMAGFMHSQEEVLSEQLQENGKEIKDTAMDTQVEAHNILEVLAGGGETIHHLSIFWQSFTSVGKTFAEKIPQESTIPNITFQIGTILTFSWHLQIKMRL